MLLQNTHCGKKYIYSSNPSVFFGAGKSSAGELDPILCTQRCEQTGKTTKKSNNDNKKTRKHNLCVVRLKELGSIHVKKQNLRNVICIFRYRPSQARRGKKKIQFTMSSVGKK